MSSYQRITQCYEMLVMCPDGVDAELLTRVLKLKNVRSIRRFIRGLRDAGVPVLVTREGRSRYYTIPNSYRKKLIASLPSL